MRSCSGRVLLKFIGCLIMASCVFGSSTDQLAAAEPVRTPWNESRVIGSPDPPLPYRVARDFEQLPLFQPVYLRAEPGTNRYFLVDHKGAWAGPGGIRVFDNRDDVDTSEALLHLDRLIYGFCFHPQYQQNGFIYVISNGPIQESVKHNRISRFTIERKPNGMLIPDSEQVILEWESNGHNGGDLAFGPDGFLYCPTGDGTSDSDTLQTGQGLDDLLAVMLRLDVDHPTGDLQYSVPADNPFVDVPGARPEIWAYGFRNPWRMDYDHESNQLWVGQNGQDLWEQVYLVRKGENYGWSVNEGSHPFYPERPTGPQPITMPVAEHHHSESRSLTGGVVYRGDKFPELRGAFIYGDYSTGKIWGVRHDGQQVTFQQELADTTLQITGFALDHAKELLIVDHGGGLYRLESMPPSEPTNFPRLLTETGLFTSVPEHRLHPGVVPYSVNAPLWSDGAHKARWFAVPGDEQIDFTAKNGWNFPNGTVLVKSFGLDQEAGRSESRRWVETRLMVRQQNEWVGYSYQWNAEQTDAVLLDSAGADVEFQIRDAAAEGGIRRQTWHYPGRAECMVCHSRAANYVLGLSENQMNRTHDYDGVVMNQIEMLEQLKFFQKPLPRPVSEMSRLTDPLDENADLQARATSYLHANCANCHVSAGGGNAAFSIDINTEPQQAKLYDAVPVHSTFGIGDARIIANGAPERSLLLHRMQRRGPGQMPPLASIIPDSSAVELIRRWIEQLPPAE